MKYWITRVHWPTAGVHRLSLYLEGTPVFFESMSDFLLVCKRVLTIVKAVRVGAVRLTNMS